MNLNCDKVLIGDDLTMKICDMSSAVKISQENSPIEDQLSHNESKQAKLVQTDILALGVILFTMKFNTPPFGKAVRSDRNFLILQTKPEKFWNLPFITKKYKNRLSPAFISLMNKMLSEDQTKRFNSVTQVLQHPYFEKESRSKTANKHINAN